MEDFIAYLHDKSNKNMETVKIKFKKCWFSKYMIAEIWEKTTPTSYEGFENNNSYFRLVQVAQFNTKTGQVRWFEQYNGREMCFPTQSGDLIRKEWLKQNSSWGLT